MGIIKVFRDAEGLLCATILADKCFEGLSRVVAFKTEPQYNLHL